MPRPPKVGYDIGVESLKIAVKDSDGMRFFEERLPENLVNDNTITSPNALCLFLRDTKRKYKVPAGPASLALPYGRALCQFVNMPKMTAEQLDLNLPHEFADLLQGDASRYKFDYAMCKSQNEDELALMAAAADKIMLTEINKIFSRAGIKLTTILPPEMALLNLAKKSDDSEICFVDLGQRKTRITLIRGDHIQAERVLNLAGIDIDNAIAAEFGVDPYLANTYKYNNYKGALEIQSVRDIREQITVELLKVINFYRFTYRDADLNGIYLIGGGGNLPYLRRAIAEELDSEPLPISNLVTEGAETFAYAAGALMGDK